MRSRSRCPTSVSSQPSTTTQSLFRNTRTSPRARAAAWLLPAAKPALCAFSTTMSGKSARAAVSRAATPACRRDDALSTTIDLERQRPGGALDRRQAQPRQRQVVVGDDEDRRPRRRVVAHPAASDRARPARPTARTSARTRPAVASVMRAGYEPEAQPLGDDARQRDRAARPSGSVRASSCTACRGR